MTREELFALAESKHDIRISESIQEGFKIFQKNAGGFIGITVIYLIVNYVLNLIPFVGSTITNFVGAFFYAGMIVVCKKIRNEEEVQFNDFFEVFKNPGPFILLVFVQFAIIFLMAIPAVAFFFIRYKDVFVGSATPSIEMYYSIGPVIFLALIPVFFLSMCYTFSFHVYLFINQDFWTAMEASRKLVMKNFFSILGFYFVLGLMLIFGLIVTCGLGLFVLFPLIAGSIYVVFDSIFKPNTNTFDTKVETFGAHEKDLNTETEEKNL